MDGAFETINIPTSRGARLSPMFDGAASAETAPSEPPKKLVATILDGRTIVASPDERDPSGGSFLEVQWYFEDGALVPDPLTYLLRPDEQLEAFARAAPLLKELPDLLSPQTERACEQRIEGDALARASAARGLVSGADYRERISLPGGVTIAPNGVVASMQWYTRVWESGQQKAGTRLMMAVSNALDFSGATYESITGGVLGTICCRKSQRRFQEYCVQQISEEDGVRSSTEITCLNFCAASEDEARERTRILSEAGKLFEPKVTIGRR
jgi:hypothetical protein